MEFQPDPVDVVAIIVGVEQYAVPGGEWPFAGPALDAAKFAAWLAARGVPEANLMLFLSPIDGDRWEAHRELVRSTVAGAGVAWDKVRQATSDNIYGWLEDELPRQTQRNVVFFWSGHGSAVEDERRLFCANAAESLHNFNFTDFAKKLRHERYRRFARQLLIVDTCANLHSQMNHSRTLPDRKLAGDREDATIAQLSMFSASYGEFALHRTDRCTSAFFELLYERLQSNADRRSWPHFLELLDAVGQRLDEDGETTQQPVYWHRKGASEKSSAAGLPVGSSRVASLFSALSAVEAELSKLRIHFNRTCAEHPDVALKRSLVEMVSFLDQLVPRADGTSAADEFALRVKEAFPDTPKLDEWIEIRRRSNPGLFETLRARLDLPRNVATITHRLVVRLDSLADGRFKWLHVTGTADVPLSDKYTEAQIPAPGGVDGLAAAIGAIAEGLHTAEQELLAIELVVDVHHMELDIESTRILDPTVGLERPLGHDYVITVRWDKRVDGKLSRPLINAWHDWGNRLRDRLAHALTIEWAAVADLDKALTNIRGTNGAQLLGLEFKNGPAMDTLKQCLAKGVPFAIWTSGPTARSRKARAAIVRCVACYRGNEWLNHLTEMRVEVPFKVLWDPPDAKVDVLQGPF